MRRRRDGNGLDAWPGYVDALSTLLMVTIFVLLVFVLAEAFLSYALKGSDSAIDQLKNQVAELTQSLSLETAKNATITQELSTLNAQLASAQSNNATLTSQMMLSNTTLSSLQAQAESNTDLVTAQALNKQDAAQITLLNQQMAALRAQLAALQVALDAAQSSDLKDHVQIADLGKQLNEALARKVSELAQYQSAFFKALSQSLQGEKNIKVVGDRFVFESDVLFASDSATITPAGQAEIAQVAKAIKNIAQKIPPNVSWALSVDGYADSQAIIGGKYKSNFDLSTARALAVLDLLIANGVPSNRLMATGMGSNNPIAPGNTPADYAQNRRIEFRLTAP